MTGVLHTIHDTRMALSGANIALVPTMGALHDGHRALIRAARQHADVVVVSVFVNPMQFTDAADFDRYPRALEDDLAFLRTEGVDWVFAPDAQEMYPRPPHTATAVTLRAGAAGVPFEGAARPGHFDGMLTVVLKLLNVVQPRSVVFGQKDAQQLALVRQLVRDVNLPVQIVAVPTVRADDGLALSSRNRFLTAEQRAAAPTIWAALQHVAQHWTGSGPAAALEGGRRLILAQPDLQIEYFEAVHPETFLLVTDAAQPALIVAAVRAGSTRLLDNLPLG